MSANARQVGGSHYQAAIQHWDLIEEHGIGYLEGCSSKYVTRWRNKNGLQDLEKSVHYAEKLRELTLAGKRKPRGIVPFDVVQEFCQANSLDPIESRVIEMLCRWDCVEDLDVAIHNINLLISQASN